jgi:integrase/recombinase XerD
MAKNFGRPNNARKLPNVFNKKQLIKLFEEIKDSHVFMGALIALFCGLRISEVCNLKKQDIDLETEKVLVREGKGSKDRIVMLPSSLKPVIEKWYRLNKDSEYFVCTQRNHKYFQNILSKKFKACLEKAGLSIKTFKTSVGQQRYAYSFHTLRHTYATYLLEQGVDLYYVQRSLGHVDIHTTQVYAYISNKDLQSKINMAFGSKKKKERDLSGISDPIHLLKLKFANNEISLEEFEEKYEVLKKFDEGNAFA